MDMLKVALSMVPADGLEIDLDITEAMVRPEGVDSPRIKDLSLTGEILPIDTDVLVRGTLSGTVWATCDRCLDPAEAAIHIEVEWLFVPGHAHHPLEAEEDPEDEELEESAEIAGVHDGETLDLAPRVWEETVLAVPAKVLCNESCQGLCPWCGANKNNTACSCDAKHAQDDDLANTGLRKLGDLFPNLKPKRPEE
ncbi:MAG: hypothetical protein AMXMBFR84_11710 [Candidatus Hydrogenedentota bacterium]